MSVRFVGWTLIHTIWQCGVIAVVVGGVLAVARRAAPSTRYIIAMTGLVLALVVPIATATWSVLPATEFATIGGGVRTPSPALNVPAPDQLAVALRDAIGVSAIDPSPFGTTSVLARMRGRLDASLTWIVAAWLAGIFVLLGRLAGGAMRLRGLRREGLVPASAEVVLLAARVAARLGVRHAFRVYESCRVHGPVVVGWVRPIILIPVALTTGLTPAQLETLLAHELAHIRRYNVLFNTVQTVVETLLFFHPGVWWLSAQVREERERCCDDLAVASCRGDIATYMSALLALEENRARMPALATAATGGTLLRRVRRLALGESARTTFGSAWIAGAIASTAVLVVLGHESAAAPHRVAVRPADSVAVFADAVQHPRISPAPRAVIREQPPAQLTDVIDGRVVFRYTGSGPLEERWAWAMRSRPDLNPDYWVGYSISGTDSTRLYHFDDSVSIRVDGERESGQIVVRAAMLGKMRAPGVALAPFIGQHGPGDIVILLGVGARGNGREIVRFHFASASLPAVLGDRPLVWLGTTTHRESIALLDRTLRDMTTRGAQRDLIAAIGAHRDSPAAAATLTRWITDAAAPDRVREEAVEWLVEHPIAASIDALRQVALSDRDNDIRKEAIDALADLPDGLGVPALLALAQDTSRAARARGDDDDGTPQQRAVEALAEARPRALAVDGLTHLARTHPSRSLRTSAVRELGEMRRDTNAVVALADLSTSSGDKRVRETAAALLKRRQQP